MFRPENKRGQSEVSPMRFGKICSVCVCTTNQFCAQQFLSTPVDQQSIFYQVAWPSTEARVDLSIQFVPAEIDICGKAFLGCS